MPVTAPWSMTLPVSREGTKEIGSVGLSDAHYTQDDLQAKLCRVISLQSTSVTHDIKLTSVLAFILTDHQ